MRPPLSPRCGAEWAQALRAGHREPEAPDGGRCNDRAGLAAQPGLTAVTGKFAARSVGAHFTRCQLRHRARICLASVTGHGGFFSGVLIFSVASPHHHPVAFFLLGLSGSGARARTIFDSMRLK